MLYKDRSRASLWLGKLAAPFSGLFVILKLVPPNIYLQSPTGEQCKAHLDSVSEITKELEQSGQIIESTTKRPLNIDRQDKKMLLTMVDKQRLSISGKVKGRSTGEQIATPGQKTEEKMNHTDLSKNRLRKSAEWKSQTKVTKEMESEKVTHGSTKENRLGGADQNLNKISSHTRFKTIRAQGMYLDGCLKKVTSSSKRICFVAKE